MKHIIFLVVSLFGFSVLAMGAGDVACKEKLKTLEDSGVKLSVLRQAMKNFSAGDMKSRYILLAETGKEKGKGTLRVVDLATGTVKVLPMTAGYPENYSAAVQPSADEKTMFGPMTLNLNEETMSEAYFKKYHRLETAPSEAIKYKFGANGQQLLSCSKKFKPNNYSKNDLCIEPDDMEELRSALASEQQEKTQGLKKPSVLLYTYPSWGLPKYMEKLDPAYATASNDGICKAFAAAAADGGSATGAPGVNAPAAGRN